MVEVTVVVAVLIVVAAMAMPALSRQNQQIAARDFGPGLRRIVNSARSAAIERNVTTYLAWDESQTKVILYTQGTSDGGDEALSSINIPNGITANRFNLGDQESNAGDWKLHFYADGSSEGGGVEFAQGTKTMNMDVSTRAVGILADGNLADYSASHWAAGDFVHRQ